MILACHNLNKSFGDHLIVRDGSFHVEDREKAALVGVNGAGKSTILNRSWENSLWMTGMSF